MHATRAHPGACGVLFHFQINLKGSTMSTDHVPVPDQYIQTVKTSGRPLFDMGELVSSPAVLAHLDQHGVYPSVLLSQHVHGEWGVVDAHDAKCNDAAIQNGGRIVSAYDVEGTRIWVITEAESGGPNRQRASTCLLLPDEY
jgi:hypothetical protein